MSAGGQVAAGRCHAAALAMVHAMAFPEAPWPAASIAALFDNPATFGFLDDRGGMVIARAVAGEAEILAIGVVPTGRRAGVGRALLAAALDEARARGAARVFLEVAHANAAAIGLYRAAGFGDAGRRRDYYGAGRDALLLSHPPCGSPE